MNLRQLCLGLGLLLVVPRGAQAFILHGSTVTFANGAAYSTADDIVIVSGSMVTNGAAVNVAGSFISSGTFTAPTSTLTFNGAGSGNMINLGRASVYRLNITGSGEWTTVSNPLTVSSTVVLSAGSLTLMSPSTMTVVGNVTIASDATLLLNADMRINGGSLINAGTVDSNNPAAVLTLPAAGAIGGSGSTRVPSLSLPNSAQTTTLAGPLSLVGSLTNGAGHILDTSAAGNYALTVSSSWMNSGTYVARSSSVSFDGSSLGLTITPGSSAFYQLAITGGGSWSAMTNPLTISNSIAMEAGTLTCLAGSSMTVSGSIDIQSPGTLILQDNLQINGGSLTNAGTLTSLVTSTVTLNGSGTLGGPGSTTLPHLILNGAGQTTTLGGDISTQGQLTLNSGHTLDTSAGGNYQITISSNWTNAGTFVARAGTVEFASTATLMGQTTFYNFSALTPGFTLTFPAASTQTVTGALTFAGTSTNLIKLRSSTNGSRWYFKNTGSNGIFAVDVKDSVASANTLNASASLDSTNNINWTFGATRTWVGPGNWSSAANWNPSGVPGGNDSVIFNNANNCTVDISTTVATVALQAGYSGTITANQPLTLNGGYTQAAGAFSLGTSTLSVGSNWTVTGGTFTPGTGTVLFTAVSSGRSIKTGGRNFYNVTFNGNGGYWTLQDSMTVRSTLTLAAGTLDSHAVGNYGLSVGREWLNTGGSFIANLSTVTLTGTIAGLRIQSDSNGFGYLALTGAGSWVTDNGLVPLSGDLSVSNGSLTVASGSPMTIGGNVTVQSGTTFSLQDDVAIAGGSLVNSGIVTSAASATLALSGTGTLGGSGSTRLPTLALSGNLQTTTLSGALILQGSLTNATGHILDASNAGHYALTVSSSWINAGSYIARTSSVSLNGSSAGLLIDPGSSPFYTFALTGPGMWTTTHTPITVSSVVYINAGTLTVAAGSSMTVTGNINVSAAGTLGIQEAIGLTGGTLANAGFITASDPTKTVTLSGAGTLGGNGSTIIPGLTLSGAAQTTMLAGAVNIIGDLLNGSGHSLDANTISNFPLTISQSWTNSGTYIARASSVTLNGSNVGLSIISGNSPFYKLAVTGSGSWQTSTNPLTISSTVVLSGGTFLIASGSTMTVNGSLNVQAGATLDIEDHLSLLSSLINSGTVTTTSDSALVTSSGTMQLGGAGSTLLPRLTLSGVAQTTTLAGPLSILGDISNQSGHILDMNNGGNYALTVSSSWVNSGVFLTRASSMSFNGSMNGLVINPGTSPMYIVAITGPGQWSPAATPLTISNTLRISNGSFSVVASSLTVNGNIDIQSGGTLDLQNNIFIGGGSLTNAGTLTSIDTSSMTLKGAGTLGGTGTTILPHLILNGSGQTTTLDGDIAAQGQLTISAGHTLDANSGGNYQIVVSSNWSNAGTFLPQSGDVTFDSTATLTGNNPFYSLSAVTPGITLKLTAGSTQTISGVFTLTGASGNPVTLRSTTSGTRAYLRSLGSVNLSFVDVKDNGATGNVLSAAASTDSGNNVNWVFATTRIWKGSSSTLWNLAANWSPSGIPASVDTVVFDNTSTRACSINANSVVATFTMTGANTRAISFSAGTIKLTVTGDLTIGGGTFTQGTSPVMVGGSWNKSGGIYTPGTSSVTFNGSGLANTISTGGTAFFKIGFIGPGQWSTTGTALTVSSHVVMTAGTLVVATGSSMTIVGNLDIGALAAVTIQDGLSINGGSLLNAGAVNSLASGAVLLTGTGTLGGAGTTILPALTVTGAGQTTMLTGAITTLGNLTNTASHTFDVSAAGNYAITLNSDWTNAGVFNAQIGTVTFSASAILTGNSTFYNLTDTTPGSSLTFTAGSTQTVSGLLTLAGASGNPIQLVSSTTNPWYLRMNGNSIVGEVAVQRSVISGAVIYAGQSSIDNGQNVNWIFDYPSGAITTMTATPELNGDITLRWMAPTDPDDNPFGSGSQYAIEWATYTVVWSTVNVGDSGYALTHHLYLSTSAVNSGDTQVVVSTGLTGNVPYQFRLWIADPLGVWSPVSNAATATVTPLLSVYFSTHTYAFGVVNMGATTISTSAIIVGNVANVTQTYSLSVSTIGPLTVWAPATGLPTMMDRFVLFGSFGATQPGVTAFGAEDVITSTPASATSVVFSAGTETGVSVPQTSDRHLWLRFDMPPLTTTIDPQQMSVVISASTP